jgi:hypothetical protein
MAANSKRIQIFAFGAVETWTNSQHHGLCADDFRNKWIEAQRPPIFQWSSTKLPILSGRHRSITNTQHSQRAGFAHGWSAFVEQLVFDCDDAGLDLAVHRTRAESACDGRCRNFGGFGQT